MLLQDLEIQLFGLLHKILIILSTMFQLMIPPLPMVITGETLTYPIIETRTHIGTSFTLDIQESKQKPSISNFAQEVVKLSQKPGQTCSIDIHLQLFTLCQDQLNFNQWEDISSIHSFGIEDQVSQVPLMKLMHLEHRECRLLHFC